MAKPGFIKLKKVWKKHFDEKTLEDLEQFFKSFFPAVNWEETSYVEVLGVNRFTPIYPETDKYDDSEGIHPKQVKAFVEKFSMEEFKQLASFLSEYGEFFPSRYMVQDKEPESPFFYSWRTAWESNVANLETKTDIGNMMFGLLKRATGQKAVFPQGSDGVDFYSYDSEIKKAIFENREDTVLAINEILKAKTFPRGTTLSLKQLKMEDFIESRKELWLKTHKFVPKVKEMLFTDPKGWEKTSFIESIEMFHGVKQLEKLAQPEKESFLRLYKTFGKALPYVGDYLKRYQQLNTVNLRNGIELASVAKDTQLQGFSRVLSEMTRGVNVVCTVEELTNILVTFVYFEDTTTELMKKIDNHAVMVRDIDNLKESGSFVTQMISNGESLSFLKDINFRDLSIFKKYPFNKDEITQCISLYKRTFELKTTVPLYKGKIGQYEFEMIDKNDIRGLAAGNATQCCQRLGGLGRTCVVYGQEKENSTFFLITKNGEIHAQSWVWMIDGQLTFDSLEMKGSSAEAMNTFIECYKEYSDFAIKQKGIKLITIGGGRVSGHFNRMDAGDYIQIQEKVPNQYTDARTQYLIKKKK